MKEVAIPFIWRDSGLVASVLLAAVFVCIPFVDHGSEGMRWLIYVIAVGGLLGTFLAFNALRKKFMFETTPEGIIAGGFVRYYIPWENVQDISVEGLTGLRFALYTVLSRWGQAERVSIRVIDTDEVYYDLYLHRILGFLFRKGNLISLEPFAYTRKGSPEVVEKLVERWQEVKRKTADG